jgi:hypothetical protein
MSTIVYSGLRGRKSLLGSYPVWAQTRNGS